ncbi:DUF58 domain-containing protein [Agromyces tardus]|uniref:DUF58 domain-containing protein n=1 Tax=Agromyces tardus TaxID=2583849 RepID=A0A3M8A2P2_9MICO|nr:DUF58 domain-containing protein [Agromyces tardus]RNB45454.1 DUF58 domain-containing protein [Agromyces tardus]
MPRARLLRVQAWPRLTRRGGTLLVVGVLLLVLSLWFDLRDILLLAFVGIAMPLAALAFVALQAPRVAVQRAFEPPVVPAGAWATVRLVVQNRSRRTFDGARWRDTVQAGLAAPAEAILPALGRWEGALPSGDDTVRLEYRLRTPRRGVYAVGPLRIGTADPFGLARIARVVGNAHDLVVTPRVTELDATVGSVASIDGSLHGLQRRTHPNSDELIAREYRYGDPLRRVNWAATARRGELMVREEEQRGDPEARLLVDTTLSGRAAQAQARREPGDPPDLRFELGIEIAASVGVHLLEHGFRLRCDPLHAPASIAGQLGAGEVYRSPGGEHAFLEDLARLETPGRGRAHRDRERDQAAELIAPRSREARMPGIAVLIDPDVVEAHALVALRPTLEPAIAFVTESVSPTVIELLEESDWRIVTVRRPNEIASAWTSAWRDARGGAAQRSGAGRAR